MNILYTSVAIYQLKCLDYAFFVAKMSKMTFTRFGGQVLLDGGQVRQFRGRAGGSLGGVLASLFVIVSTTLG